LRLILPSYALLRLNCLGEDLPLVEVRCEDWQRIGENRDFAERFHADSVRC